MSALPPTLVTGATGFIGQHLALRLIQTAQPMRLLARDPDRLHPTLRARAEVVIGDLTTPSSLAAAVAGVGTVYHCAANVSTWDRADHYRRVNVEGLSHLLGAIAASGMPMARFVHLSSVDVYGFPPQPCDENCPTHSAGFGYGDSKIAGEAVLREFAARTNLPFTILRPTNVIGPRSPFVQRIGDELRSGLMLTIDHGRADCGFLDVDNLIDAMVWAATADAAIGETFNVRDPQAVTWRRFVDDLRADIGGRGIVLDLPFAVADAAAAAVQAPYSLLRLRSEPLLHRLIVRIFGRTCGHDAGKLARAGCPVGRVPYAQAMQSAMSWYRQQAAAR